MPLVLDIKTKATLIQTTSPHFVEATYRTLAHNPEHGKHRFSQLQLSGVIRERVRLIPQGLPLAVGSEDSQVSDLVGMVVQPGGACLLEARLQPMVMPAFDVMNQDLTGARYAHNDTLWFMERTTTPVQ